MNKPILLGITGGIGSGKSVVTHLLQLKGIPVYDCDFRAKVLMSTSTELQKKLTALVGQEVFPQGKLDKEVLSTYLFASGEHADAVNRIVHPCVLDDFKLWIEKLGSNRFLAVESALLFEAGFDAVVDHIVMVYSSQESRIARVMHRDGLHQELVLKKIKAQMSDEKKRQQADSLIINDEQHSLIEQVEALILELSSRI